MRREQRSSAALALGVVATALLLASCSSAVQLNSAVDSTAAAASDSPTTPAPTTPAPTTPAPTTPPPPPTTAPVPITVPATTAAPATPAPGPTATTEAAPPTTDSGPCPVVPHNPATTAGCGDATPLVLEVQRELSCVGDPVVQDGVFGASTYRAVLAFQRSTTGLVADGLAGPQTRAYIHDNCLAGDY